MNIKNSLIVGIVIIIVLVAGIFYWKGGPSGQNTEITQPTVTGQINGQRVVNGKIVGGQTDTGQINGQVVGGQMDAETEKNLKMANEVFKNEDIGKMTFDIYVEVTAWITYLNLQNDADFENSTELKKIFNKYDVTIQNLGAYSVKEVNTGDTNRLIEFSNRVAQRVSELEKTGGR